MGVELAAHLSDKYATAYVKVRPLNLPAAEVIGNISNVRSAPVNPRQKILSTCSSLVPLLLNNGKRLNHIFHKTFNSSVFTYFNHEEQKIAKLVNVFTL